MKLNLCLLLITLAILSACRKDSIEPSPTDNTPPIDSTSVTDTTSTVDSNIVANTPPLIPLAVGNTWVYERHTYNDSDSIGIIDTVSYTISPTVLIDGATYYPFSTNEIFFYGQNPLLRKENGEYFKKNGASGIELLFLKDSAFVGDVYVGQQVRKVNETVTTPMGIFNQVVSIRYVSASNSSPLLVHIIDRNFKAGVGLVSGKRTRSQSFFTYTTTIKLISYTLY